MAPFLIRAFQFFARYHHVLIPLGRFFLKLFARIKSRKKTDPETSNESPGP